MWLLRGKACFKQELARRVELDVTVLPYHAEFLNWLREQHAQGRRLILTTASPMLFARQVADHLGIFTEVMATEGTINLVGTHKSQRLCQTFGERGFDYAGNARVDVAIWSQARKAILVNPETGVEGQVQQVAEIAGKFEEQAGSRWQTWLRAIRLHQWLKNVLVFVPLLAAHRVNEPALLLQAVTAYLTFGLCASSVYLLNDLLDLPADRHHPHKRQRPFAAGSLPILQGILAILLLLGAALLVAAALLPVQFLVVLLGYYMLTLSYSMYFKQSPMLDVVILAMLYTTRIIGGATAVSIMLSFWLLAFSVFIFLSLALVKRYAELTIMLHEGQQTAMGRGYHVDDLYLLQTLGVASGYLSVLVLALYINSSNSQTLYRHPEALWLLCLLLLYWISRIWFKTHRGEMHDDPVIFAISDRISRILVIISALILWVAI